MRGTTFSNGDRGQAFTLEGFVSAMVVLLALLFALQSVVLMPTTGGSGDRATLLQDERELKDALIVAATADGATDPGDVADDGNLSELLRYWDPDGDENGDGVEGEFYEASQTTAAPEGQYTNGSEMETVLGHTLHERMSGDAYSVELVYTNESSEAETLPLIYQPSAGSGAVTASYTVTLYNASTLTAPSHGGTTIAESYDNDSYPIPPHPDLDDNEVYNVVEVRVTWQR